VVDRVAQQMQQHLAKAVQHLPIGLRATIIQIEDSALAGSAGYIAHLEAERAKKPREREHARAPDLIVQPIGDKAEARRILAEVAHMAG